MLEKSQGRRQQILLARLRAVALGELSIGTPSDPASWQYQPAAELTPEQVMQLSSILQTFSFARPAPIEIKEEAERRILARYPIHKQLNALARSTELMLQGQANWSTADAAEAADLLAMRAWIKSVRDVSNALEQSLPEDFAADGRWPA